MATTNTTTNTNIVRVTKAQKYNAIIALLEGKDPVVIPATETKQGVTLDAKFLCDFCRNELNLLEKKNSGDKKPTATQEANAGLREKIMEYLLTLAPEESKTSTEIALAVPGIITPQKAVPLMKRLVEDGRVKKELVKGKPRFSAVR